MRGFRNLAVVTAVCIYAQIVLGGVVRITGSGLGCRDWPLCYQHETQRFAYRTLLEVAHRLFGTATGLLVVACTLLAVVLYRRGRSVFPRGLAVATAVLLGLYVFQGVLGGVTVLMKNQSLTVAIHLGNSLLVLAMAILVAAWAGRALAPTGNVARSGSAGIMIYIGLAAAFVVVVSGAYVVGTGAGAACPGWPLCGAAHRSALTDIHFLHRVVVLLGGLVLLRGMHAAAKRWRGQRVAGAAYLAGLAFALEVAVGALQALSGLPSVLRAAHLALATATWAMLAVSASVLWLEGHASREGMASSRPSATPARAGS